MTNISPDQKKLNSGLGLRTTAVEALGGRDLAGLNIIVTGGHSGLGRETVRALAGAGASVTVASRNPDAARAELAEVAGDVTVMALDLSVPDLIDAFAAAWLAQGRPLDILINNAAVMACPLTRDSRGYESQFATNHLGHFQLTARLWPALAQAGAKTGAARVVSLSSIGHRISGADLDDPHFERQAYDKWVSYGRAKSANALFAIGLDARGKANGVRAFAVHPGGIMTNLQRHLSMEEQIAMGWIDAEGRVNEQFKTPEQGAATSVWAATSAMLAGIGGVYCEDCDVADVALPGAAGWTGVRPHAVDQQIAERLWALSEAQTGVALPDG